MTSPIKRLIPPLILLALLLTITFLYTRAASSITDHQSPITNSGAPNLRPSAPFGWSDPLVPTFITGTNTTETVYAGLGAVTYFDWAILNDSGTAVATPTVTCLTFDGNQINAWNIPGYDPNTFQTVEDYAYVVPEPGTFMVTVTADCTNQVAESDETDNTWTGEYTWHPYISIIISDEHGFDKCDIATTAQMNVWRNQSPYFYANIYIGGISRACPNSGLTNNWIRNVVEKGWNLIPTWVGPQAPCSAFNNRFSPNPGTAYVQGRREADAAYQAADELGLIPPDSPTILYYDLEAFPNQKLCRQASGQFLSGWTERLQELNQRSGIYGAGCGSYPVDWPNLPAPPDAVWLAHWIFSDYTPSATVWDIACVPNSLWDNNERIRQYAGGHNEEWGGVTFNIDSNVALGPVVGINPSLQSTQIENSNPIQDFQLLAPDQGWLLQNHQLLWKNPGETTWANVTPTNAFPLAAHFLTPNTGWIASPALMGDQIALNLLHTSDQGQTWDPAGTLTLLTQDAPGNVWIHFTDKQTGWVAIQLPSSSNFSLGQLYRTMDGGQTWEALSLPIAGRVIFINAQTGWIAGGVMGDELYVTYDGGETWSEQAPASQTAWYSLPTFVNGTGILAATSSGDSPHVAFFTSPDQGQTWQPAAEWPIPTTHPLASPLPVAIIDANTWFVANPETGNLILTQDAGKTVETLSADLDGVLQLQFLRLDAGWALTFSGDCAGSKGDGDFHCAFHSDLWQASPSAEIWTGITP